MGYNFSVAGLWGRTEGPFARGGARSVGFENPAQTPIPAGMVWTMVYDPGRFHPESPQEIVGPVSAEEIWRRFGAFLRVYDLQPSPMNAIEFCAGTVPEMAGADVYAAVDRYSRAGRIAYVHLRNVRGKVPRYHEAFVDDGDTDMLRVLAILHRNGHQGVIIPDHTPLLDCEAPWHAGVAYALGWMRAALTAIQRG